MERPQVLVIHREPALRRLVLESFGEDRVRVLSASSDEEGLSLLKSNRVHVLVAGLDVLRLGYEFVRQAAAIHPFLGVVLLVDAAFVQGASQRVAPAAVQYLSQPVTRDSLRSSIQRALDQQTLRKAADPAAESRALAVGRDRLESPAAVGPIIAASKAMREVLDLVGRCAPTDAAVLICGEPDTGKELIAREIHRQSPRAAGPFVRVACGALRESEVAQRLFGPCERDSDRGVPASFSLLESAKGGTLFLDDVANLPLWTQVRLLDALQQRRDPRSGDQGPAAADIRGGNQGHAILDVRVIASTTADLKTATAQRVFLPSLYYFLSVVPIHIPPLRHRVQDIRPLAELCLEAANAVRVRRQDKAPCRFAEETLPCLLQYDWPGNNLELASVVTHAVLLADGEKIGPAAITESLGKAVASPAAETLAVPLAGGLRQIERAVIAAVIERCRGNKAAAARVLGLHRRTLYRLLEVDATANEQGNPLPLLLDPGAADSAAGAFCS
jgi:DNA-binding NtrC family response regulator